MLALVALPMLPSTASVSAAGELKVIRTSNVRDVVVTLFGAPGAWTTGDNAFVLEFDSAPRKRLIDVGRTGVDGEVTESEALGQC